MGQKVNPIGIRLGITKPYSSVWYASTANFPANIKSDFEVRKYLTQELKNASVSKIVIDRPAKSIRVTIHTARPGIVIGKKGEDVEKLRRKITEIAGVPAQVNISEVRKPDLDAEVSCRLYCFPVRASCNVPSRYEEGNPECNARWCQGYQG